MIGEGGPDKRFAVDVMLGKLARWLRVLGFDARAANLSDPARIEAALAAGLVPVTRRDKFRNAEGVVFITADRPLEQLRELISGLALNESRFRPFSRCTVCNVPLVVISREAAFGSVPDFVYETAPDFRGCPKCARIYWPGSHRKRMLDRLASVLDTANGAD